MNFPEDEQPQAPIQIDHLKLSPEALLRVVENYIIRSGTDYGSVEVSHETKITQIKKQLVSGEVSLVYDPNTESVTMMTSRDFKQKLKDSSPS